MRLFHRKYTARVSQSGKRVAIRFFRGGAALRCPSCDEPVTLRGKAGGGTGTLQCDCKTRAVPGYQMKDLVERLERGDVP